MIQEFKGVAEVGLTFIDQLFYEVKALRLLRSHRTFKLDQEVDNRFSCERWQLDSWRHLSSADWAFGFHSETLVKASRVERSMATRQPRMLITDNRLEANDALHVFTALLIFLLLFNFVKVLVF